MNKIEILKQENRQSLLNGVYYLTGLQSNSESFENLYLKLRTIEGRIYDDEAVRNLPDISKDHRHFKEWRVRKNSSHKLIEYLSDIKKELNILEIGCGNGWFSNKIAGIKNTSVFAIDVNRQELEQAARVFGHRQNLVFAYVDIFEPKANNVLNKIKFDIIILAGVLMYFPDINLLIDMLLCLLNPKGEIHIIDNIFYNEKNIEQGRKNSIEHYKQLGVSEMINIVHHHLLSELALYKPQVLYNSNKLINRIKRKLMAGRSPFYWMKIVN